jgi:hypothetical protein
MSALLPIATAKADIDALRTLVNVDREQAAGSFSIHLVAEDEGGGTTCPLAVVRVGSQIGTALAMTGWYEQ